MESHMTVHAPHSLAVGPGEPQRRVLLVDDEGTIRHALRRFFQRQGWDVDEAADGGAALALLLDGAAEHAYDVIISDLRMPGISGIEMHERLRTARPDLLDRIIFSTGDAVSLEAAEFVRRSDCPVLQKPFELSALRELVHRMIAS
jgi:CheY-like chemotaxis protein